MALLLSMKPIAMIEGKVFPIHWNQILLKRESEHLLRSLLLFFDLSLFFVATKLAYFTRHHSWSLPHDYIVLIIIATFVFLIMSHVLGRYRSENLLHWIKQGMIVTASLFSTLSLLALLLFFLKNGDEISRLWMGYWGLKSVLFTMLGHGAIVLYFKHQFKCGYHQRRVILVGNGDQMLFLKAHCDAHYMSVVGAHVTFGVIPQELEPLPQFKTVKKIIQQCVLLDVDDVIVTSRFGKSTKQEEKVLSMLRQLPIAVRYCLPDVFIGKGMSIVEKWKGLPIVTLYRNPMLHYQFLQKRLLDIFGASFALCVFFLPMLVISLVIKLTSKGAIIFVQDRGGFGGNSIPVLKFRSMKTMDAGDSDLQQATKNDVRITSVGRFLRKFSLDELPQLINVLKGDMSLVGPRPHALSHDDAYAALIDSYAARHRMKPGITGWAQVNGLRGETDTLEKMEARVAHDLYYIENWSLWMDIKILALTPLTFFQKTAY